MSIFSQIDGGAYNQLLELLNSLCFTERAGCSQDLDFLSDDYWLKDTAVIDHIWKRKGTWEVHLVFAHYRRPRQLIKRMITACNSRKQAELTATYMRRVAAKDQRGTLRVTPNFFDICTN